MSEFAFLFPGQGSQVVGMGKELAEKTEIGKKTFKAADEILGYSLSAICFNGPEDELKLTTNTQPALLTVSYILYQLLGKQPLLAAGHSLGEYSALVCAGAMRFEDAVLLVNNRGRSMQEAVPVGQGAMAALIGATIEKVKDITSHASGIVDIANWNSATQIVISGEKTAVEKAVADIAAAKSVFLPVSAPFHSRLMLPAEEKLALDLDRITFADPLFPVINNVAVETVKTAAHAREGLKKQVSRPVLWHATMEKMLKEHNLVKFAEIGSGKVLAGLIKRTAKEMGCGAECVNIETLADLDKAVSL
jgi:[acyl-carrier-protein] S-malonyltransferase